MLQNSGNSLDPLLKPTSATTEPQLLRNLSLLETWGFGLTGLLLWIGVAPGTQEELGAQAMWVWVPGAIVGVLVNLQVRQLGLLLPNISGGTPSYVTHLLKEYPRLTSYAAIGYFISWVAVLPINGIILSNLVQAILEPLGIFLPDAVLQIGFTVLAFIVALSGSHALGTLHLIFIVPAVGFLLAFCLQGSQAVFFSGANLDFLPGDGSTFSFQGWAKWYLNGTYAFYACETAAVFVADSKRPQGTLQSLLVAAGLLPFVYIGGSWLLLHLVQTPGLRDDTFLTLFSAAQTFWGKYTPFLVTFLVVSSSLLTSASAVAVCPRILYQLAQDHHISPVLGVTSRQGVFTPGLLLTLVLSLVWLTFGNVNRIVMITVVGWLVCFIVLHWGLWKKRHQYPGVLFPWLSLGFCAMELVVLVVGGLAWGLPDLLIGLLLPIAVLLIDRLLQNLSWQPLKPEWWIKHYELRRQKSLQSFIGLQVLILTLFIGGATIISWFSSTLVTRSPVNNQAHPDLLIVLILVLSFIGVAIACWTIFPQIVAVNTARQQAEKLSADLQQTIAALQQTQLQMVQQEKMSSLGQLVAGIAHEINNPINFIYGNVSYAQTYVTDLLSFIDFYQQQYPEPNPEIAAEADRIDLEFLQKDIIKLLNSMQVGTDRIREIVLSLRNFSRTDESECKTIDIHSGINSTLMILQHRLKANAEEPEIKIIKDYGELPPVECYPGQLNQVFMNILANAIDALRELGCGESMGRSPCITVRTLLTNSEWVQVSIADNGTGIPEEIKSRIFDPFFTTKPVGKGTGIGMSISYQIITEKHKGKIFCRSTPGQSTEFTIEIPLRLTAATPNLVVINSHNNGNGKDENY